VVCACVQFVMCVCVGYVMCVCVGFVMCRVCNVWCVHVWNL
jgi:hypothetical protein